MPAPTSRSLSVLLALCPLLACHGPGDSATKPPPVQVVRPPVIQVPATPSDRALFGYARVRDIATLSREIGADRLRSMAAAEGLDLSALRPGAPGALFVWDPQGAPLTKLPVAALLPMLPDSPAAAALEKRLGQGLTAPLKDQTLAAVNQQALGRATAVGPELAALAGAQSPWDLLLYVHTESLLAAYDAQIRGGIALMQVMAPQKAGGPDPKALAGMLTNLVGKLQTLKSLSLGASGLQDDLELAAVMEEKTAQQAVPMAAPDLVRILPPNPIRLQWNIHDLRQKMAPWIDLYAPMIDQVPGLMPELRAILDDMAKTGQMYTALTMSMSDPVQQGSGLSFHGSGIALCDNPEAYLAATRRMLDLFKLPGVLEAYRKMGWELSVTAQPGAKTVHGAPVDRYQTRLSVSKDATPAQREQLEKVAAKMGLTTTEVVRQGRHVLFQINGPVEPLVEGLLRGGVGQPLVATRAFPPGGVLYMDLDVKRLMAEFRGLMPSVLAAKVPTLALAPADRPVVMATYDSGAASEYRVRVPRQLISAFMAK